MRKTKVGQDIITALDSAIAFERGDKKLRTSTIRIPNEPNEWSRREIAELRKEGLDNISQPKFALILGVSPKTVMAWEQGQKSPSGSARRLLDIIQLSPAIVNALPSSEENEIIEIGAGRAKLRSAEKKRATTRKAAKKKTTRAATRKKRKA